MKEIKKYWTLYIMRFSKKSKNVKTLSPLEMGVLVSINHFQPAVPSGYWWEETNAYS